MNARSLVESDHDFSYEVADLDDHTPTQLEHLFAQFGVKPNRYRFTRVGDKVRGVWRDAAGTISRMELDVVDVGRDGRYEWVWHMQWGDSTNLYRECWWPKLIDCVDDIMNDPIHCP